MSFDRTTETIAHFVGHFDLPLHELRLRSEYSELKAEEQILREQEEIKLSGVKVKTGLKLEDYEPKLDYVPEFTFNATQDVIAPVFQNYTPSVFAQWSLLGATGRRWRCRRSQDDDAASICSNPDFDHDSQSVDDQPVR